MVPQHKPEAALTMFSNFISGSAFKPYGSYGSEDTTYERPQYQPRSAADVASESSPAPAPSGGGSSSSSSSVSHHSAHYIQSSGS